MKLSMTKFAWSALVASASIGRSHAQFPPPDLSSLDCSTLPSPCPIMEASMAAFVGIPIQNMPLEQLYCHSEGEECPLFQDYTFYYNRLLQLNNFSDSVSAYYDLVTNPDGETATGMGDCTTSYISHAACAAQLTNFSKQMATGEAYRFNELGRRRMNDLGWIQYPNSTFQGIGLGLPSEIHDAMRPILDETMGDGTVWGDLFALEGNFWSYEELLASAQDFLAEKDFLGQVELGAWVTMNLFQIVVGVDITEAEAQQFGMIQFLCTNLMEYPQSMAEECSETLQVETIIGAKQQYLQMVINALNARSDELGTVAEADEDTITSAALSILDALFFAGGLSVPTALSKGTAFYAQCLTDESFNSSDTMDLKIMGMETIRASPPVNSVARTDAATEERIVAMIGMATQDESVYGEGADQFRIRGDLNYYHTRSVNFADQAGPITGRPGTNRICPGKSLALNMMAAFWEAMHLNAWSLGEGGFTKTCQDGAACPNRCFATPDDASDAGPDSITITDINHDLDEETTTEAEPTNEAESEAEAEPTSVAEDAPVGMPNDSFLSSTAEPIEAVPFPQDEVLALQQIVADDYESVSMPASEIWKHLPMAPEDYPDSLKGILWMDQYGHYGYQNLTGQANENLLSFGDAHVAPLDRENNVVWSAGGCGGAWTIDEDFGRVTGTWFHEEFCAVNPFVFQFVFNEDYTAAQFHQFKNGTLQGPEAQGYRGTMALVPPQEEGVCPPPPEATKQERNLCAKWIRASYGVNKETGIESDLPPYIYPVFEVVGADGKPREPYFSAMLDWLEVKNTSTTQLYRKLVNLRDGETVTTPETLTQEKPVVTVTDINTGGDSVEEVEEESGEAPSSDDKPAPESGGLCLKLWPVAFLVFALSVLG